MPTIGSIEAMQRLGQQLRIEVHPLVGHIVQVVARLFFTRLLSFGSFHEPLKLGQHRLLEEAPASIVCAIIADFEGRAVPLVRRARLLH